MTELPLLFLSILAISGLISTYLGIYIWKKEKTLKQRFFTLIMLLSSFWCFTYILQLLSPIGPLTIFWANTTFISVTIIPVSFCLFSLVYTGFNDAKTINSSYLLFIIPLINIILIFTNPMHHLFWVSRTAIQTTMGSMIQSETGLLFWFHTLYSYMLLLFGVFFIIKSLFLSRHLYAKQAIFLIGGVTIPIIGNIITISGFYQIPYDLTPILFVFTGLLFSFAIFHYQLFSVIPIAREKIVEYLPESIFVIDNKHTIIDMNESAKQMIRNQYISYPNEHVVGISAHQVFDHILDPALFDITTHDKKEVKLNGDNDEKIFDLELSPIYLKKQSVKGITLIFRDITEEKKIEQKEKQRIQKIHDQQKALSALSKNHYLLTGKKQQAFSIITETAAKILHVERVSIWFLRNNQKELHCVDLYNTSGKKHESGMELKAEDLPIYFKNLTEGRAINADDAWFDPRTSEFREIYLRPFNILSMLDAPIWISGKLVGVLCHEQLNRKRHWQDFEISFAGEMTDQITQVILNEDREHAISALRESEMKYRTVFENTGTSLGVFGNDGIITMVNSEFVKLSGYEKDEIEQQMHWYDFVSDNDKKNMLAYHEQRTKKRGNPPNEYDCTIIDRNGNEKTVHVCISLIPQSSLRIVSLVDITELKETYAKLQELNNTLEKQVEKRTSAINYLLKQKDEFITQLGHDLKNPLGPIINLLPLLEQQENDAKKKEMINIMYRNAGYIKNLVTKTLKLARLNSPNTKLSIEPILLREQVEIVISKNTFLFKEKNMEIHNKISNEIIVSADRLRLEEVFTNLLSNSIKYSENNGTIIIDAEKLTNAIQVSIQDNGIGMTQEQLNRLFDEFYKVDSARHDFESSGLGMSIAKRIIEKHGGKIWAESQGLGKGTMFYFTIPQHQKIKKPGNDIDDSYETMTTHIDNILA